MKTDFEKFWDEHYEYLIADGGNEDMAYFIWFNALECKKNTSPEPGETTQEKGRPFKEGDRVVSTYYGEGYIVEDDGSSTPLSVEFEEGLRIWHYRSGHDNINQGHITHLD